MLFHSIQLTVVRLRTGRRSVRKPLPRSSEDAPGDTFGDMSGDTSGDTSGDASGDTLAGRLDLNVNGPAANKSGRINGKHGAQFETVTG